MHSNTDPPAARRPVIARGRLEPLGEIPFHSNGPLTRWLMASEALAPDMACFVALHQFSDVPAADRHYCQVHVHDYDEINIFHTNDALRVTVQLDDETIDVDAPATVFIPAGTRHAANVNSGTGFMVAVLFDGAFRATSGAG